MKSSNRFPFTKTRLAALPVPQDRRRVYHHDAKTEGLTICVTPAGTKTFYLYKWTNGRPVRIPLGRFPAMSVEQAQNQARTLVGEIAKGNDPQAARQAARHEHTVQGLWQFWFDTHAKPHKKTWQEDERQYNAFLKPWAGRKLSTIKKIDVQTLHARVGHEHGLYAANRMLALLRSMFNKAADIGFTGPNPTGGIKKFPEEKRDRFLHADELRAFFQSLAAEPNTTLRDYFMVALLTGARKSNVLAMRWADIDFASGVWRIPETKTGVPVVVPLTAPVVVILESRRDATNGSQWVFPSRGKTGHLVEPKSAWKRIVDRAGLVDVRPHDLRRSLGSWMAMTGAGLPIVGKMLGHTQPTTTAIYARLAVDPVRQAAEVATTAMLAAGGVELLGNESQEKSGEG